MLPGLVAGVCVGLGVVLAARGLRPSRPALTAGLARLEGGNPRHSEATAAALGGDGIRARTRSGVLAWVTRVLESTGSDLGVIRGDLRVAGRPIEKHLVDKALLAWVFAGLPLATATLLRAGGVLVPWGLVPVASLILAAVGFVVPDLTLRSEAARRRREFRHALGAYLELVVIVVAGGGGTETALHEAADAGDHWALDEIRRALGASRVSGTAPWLALQRLGEELGVDDLTELAASVGLAGERGARVRASLAAKASSMREHQLAEIEEEAQAATERMSVPVVLLLFGFLAFVLYPALQFVLEGL